MELAMKSEQKFSQSFLYNRARLRQKARRKTFRRPAAWGSPWDVAKRFLRGRMMEDLERIVRTHGELRRLTNAELRAEINRCFEGRDYRRSWALYLELQHRKTLRPNSC
jgi:hypothetical protein